MHERGFMEKAPQMPGILLASGNKIATKKKKNLNIASNRTNFEGVRGSPLLMFSLIAMKRYQECYTVTQMTT